MDAFVELFTRPKETTQIFAPEIASYAEFVVIANYRFRLGTLLDTIVDLVKKTNLNPNQEKLMKANEQNRADSYRTKNWGRAAPLAIARIRE